MTGFGNRIKNRRGFTLAEALLALAILIILFALLVPNLIRIRKELRQKELDAKAEILYIAAQNQLVKLRASGNAEKYRADQYYQGQSTDNHNLSYIPQDATPERDKQNAVIFNYYYISSLDLADPNSPASFILTDEVADAQLGSGYWIVEYQPEYARVHAVFFFDSEDQLRYYLAHPNELDKLRERERSDKAGRYNKGAHVGYYGGEAQQTETGTSYTLTPVITPHNGETLNAFLYCETPNNAYKLFFDFTVRDEYGNSYTQTITQNSSPLKLTKEGLVYSVTVTLDDLRTDNLRFTKLYGSQSGHGAGKELVEGSKLTLSLTVRSDSGMVNPGYATPREVNSLFADDSDWEGGKAIIECGRHLQNLDASSGLNNNPAKLTYTEALQRSDIDFTKSTTWDWLDSYYDFYFNGFVNGYPRFKPISNDRLKLYDGDGKRVVGLNTSSADAAGLFAAIYGDTTLQGVRLTGSRVNGDRIGALVGTVSGTGNRIANCAAYLERSDYYQKNESTVCSSRGAVAGGLVGEVSGALAISDSFAATVFRGTTCAGGLVGSVASGGSLTVSTSYADCYVSGARTGGLVGSGTVGSLTNCYAAGFQTASVSAAGLVNGTLGSAVNCYTVSDMSSPSVSDAAQSVLSGAVFCRSDTPGAYAITEGTTGASLLAGLGGTGGAFTTQTAGTVAYNLRGQSLDNYIYPRLKANRHYGDWTAPFQPASLVYYEKYGNNTYGYHGASVRSTLKDTLAVVGDGYGVVFKRGQGEIAPENITLRIDGGAEIPLDTSVSYQVVSTDGTVYDIYPLSLETVNAAPSMTDYYRKITVTTGTVQDGTIAKTYYFNPHFAKTVGLLTNADDPVPRMPEREGETVSIRTPRHLYNLSKYYDPGEGYGCYRNTTVNTLMIQGVPTSVTVIFTQERDMDYALYDWDGFAGRSRVYSQRPIGRDSFVATYDGNCNIITNVSFVAESDKNIGMFGVNAGLLQNIVIVTDYNPKAASHYFVQRTAAIGENETVSMGVLAGQNAGTIANCAVAGYYIAGSDGMLHAYANSTLYVGGLVGRNAGLRSNITATVMNSTADCPAIMLSTSFADAAMGGFVGWNEVNGTIKNSYSLGHLELIDVRGGSVQLGGFAGRNDGKINSSYCAESMITSGTTASSHGFAPAGGLVTDCWFLNAGTYTYVGALRDYNSNTSPNLTSGSAAPYAQLAGSLRTRTAASANSYHHPNTPTASAYPFRAVLIGRGGVYVHYGDWQLAPQLGTLGVFYWEHEEGGTNDGYRITYIGTAEGSLDSGTYLCTAHDDGGAVTEYGYGYYVKGEQAADVTVQSTGIAYSAGVWDTVAAAELQKQLGDFVFYPFRTRVASDGDYIYLDNGQQRTGTWTLSYKGSNYTYEIAPFFANAMRRLDAPSAILLPANDGDANHYFDYSKAPGTADTVVNGKIVPGNPYEIRSVQQLQYINWNYAARNCSTLVTGEMGDLEAGNRQLFPYLQYATLVGSGIQTKSDATANRTVQYWQQTHDLDGTGFDAYTPIAGKATSSKSGHGASIDADRPAPLFAWFGGSYDGQSYKIQNLNIVSDSYTVGLFGVTVGADINNIILYGDGTTTVKRDTSAGTQVGNRVGAYQLGGLVALAYDYDGSDASSTISNCAISGYVIDDSSHNQHGLGYASVGGLFGVSQVELDRCSAVTDIRINYRSPNENSNKQVYSKYGNMIRVGGLTGTGLYTISDCYTGGSVTVNPDTTLHEKPWGYTGQGYVAARGNSLQIFVGGIAGSVYKYGIVNFTGGSVTSDGTVDISNSYTYLTLPRMEGNVYAASIIVGPADRFHSGAFLNASNCYYLSDRVLENYESFAYIPRDFTFDQKGRQISSLTEDEVEGILFGDLDCLPKVLFDNTANKNHSSPSPAQQNSVDYDALHDGFPSANAGMAALLNAGRAGGVAPWGWVTVTEPNGAAIDGKYSFSDESGQEGKNYPFPAVITQPDFTFGGSVNVHYGAWPADGYMWEKGRDTLDVFAQMDMSDTSSAGGPYASKTFRLKANKSAPVSGELSFSVSPADRAEYVSHVWNAEERCYEVTIRALKKGAVTVTAKEDGAALASFVISISGELKLEASDDELLLYHNEEAELTATATAKNASDKDFTDSRYGTWTVESEQTLLGAVLTDENVPANWTLTGHAPGLHTLTLTYTYNYHGGDGEELDPDCVFTETLFIPVHTLGYIGLSNGASGGHISAMRTKETELITATGFVGDVEPIARTGADVFLFADASDGDLNAFTIDRVTVTEQSGGAQYVVADAADPSAVDASRYTVSFFRTGSGAPDVESEEPYDYWGAAVRYLGDGSAPAITVTVELTDPNGAGRYKLSVPLNTVYKYSITFDGNGGSGVMRARGSNDGSFELPLCEFSKPGYAFAGWLAGGTLWQPEDTIEITGSETVQAQWTPNSYTLHFNAGDGSGAMEDLVLTYDGEAQPLPANGFTGPLNAPRFAGWNTEPDGRGTAYADLAEVRNLTTDAEITLYAQWATYRLTLNDGSSEHLYLPVNGLEVLALYEKPVMPGWILEGWYTGTEPDAVKVLDADGDIFTANVDGVTADGVFHLTGDAALYARWRKDVTLTLAAAGTAVDFQPALSEGVLAGYDPDALARDGWTLLGWYTQPTTDGVMVLAADGSIAGGAENLADYTENGSFALSENQTLYAKWSRSAYLPVEQLNTVAADGEVVGTYLIASGSAAGEQKLVTLPGTLGDKKAVAASNVNVLTATYYDASGLLHTDGSYIADAAPAKTVWTATYVIPTVNNRADYAYPRYSLMQLSGSTPYYLRDNGGDLVITPSLKYNYSGTNDYNDRLCWTYGTYGTSALACEWGIANGGRTVYWNGSAWKTAAKNTCVLFNAVQEEIVSYGWVESEP